MRDGATKYIIGAVLGAAGGFAAGTFVATPAARISGRYAIEGTVISARFLKRTTMTAAEILGTAVETAYTRVRGREAYLERQIEELRGEISRLDRSSPERDGHSS